MGRLRRIVDLLAERTEEGKRVPELGPLSGTTHDGAASTIGVLVYRGVSSSEVDEPVQRLAERLHADVVYVGSALERVHAVEPSRAIDVGFTPETAPPIDVLVVPGGLGWKQVIDDAAIRAWLHQVATDARGILAMSTGTLLLASVGRLEGREATGHWLAEGELAALGATVTSTRTASDDAGRVVTASGALAAIQVVDELADQARWAEWMP
jgi:transcriptional regulator GlxA family with amidase domain